MLPPLHPAFDVAAGEPRLGLFWYTMLVFALPEANLASGRGAGGHRATTLVDSEVVLQRSVAWNSKVYVPGFVGLNEISFRFSG